MEGLAAHPAGEAHNCVLIGELLKRAGQD